MDEQKDTSGNAGGRRLRVGLVGAGIIGNVHRAVYDKHPQAEVVAIADPRGKEVLKQSGAGYVPGSKGAEGVELPVYSSLGELLASEEVDIIDICTPTPYHRDQAIEALEAGKHVLCEKPMGRTVADCDAMLEAARRAGDRKFMIAHCLRFWPVYEYLHEAVASGRYGRVQRARFARQVIVPEGGWFLDGKASGGAILDLHIHDVDSAAWILGMPRAITAFGRIGPSGCHDQVAAVWHYDDDRLILLEGTWLKAAAGPFAMSFEVALEGATIICDSSREPSLQVCLPGGKVETPQLSPDDGYVREIDHFIRAILDNRPIERATPESSRTSVALVECEIRSIESRKTVEVESQ